MKQLEDHIIFLGSDIPLPSSPHSEALLLELRSDVRAEEPSTHDQDQDENQEDNHATSADSFALFQVSDPMFTSQNDFTYSQVDLRQPQTQNDEALWHSGQDDSPQWPINATQPAQLTPGIADFVAPSVGDFLMPFEDAVDLPWNGSHDDAFLQSTNTRMPFMMQMPHDLNDLSGSSGVEVAPNYDIESLCDDDSDNEIIEQLSVRLGDLYLADDGTLRYLGATSNMTLAQTSSLRQAIAPRRPSQRPCQSSTAPELTESMNTHLEALYFCWQDPFLHMVDREVFNSSKKQVQTGGKSPFYNEALKFAM